MPRGAYYVAERARHADMRAVRLTFREAKRLTLTLADAHAIRNVRVRRLRPTRRRLGDSRTTPQETRIRYRPVKYRGTRRPRVTLLTVIHEVAHALDCTLRRSAKRRHCGAHAILVDLLAAEVKRRGLFWPANIMMVP